MSSINRLTGHLVVFSYLLLLSCAAPATPATPIPNTVFLPTDTATNAEISSPTASSSPPPATDTLNPTVIPTATLTPIPTAQLILSENDVLPPGAVARIPPLPELKVFLPTDGKYYPFDSNQSFRVFDTETGEVLWSRYFGQRVDPSESPDERWLTASVSGTVYVWEIETGQLFRTFSNDEYSASFRGWSPDSKILVMLSEIHHPYAPVPQVLLLWDPAADEVLFQITDQNMEIGDILWTQDNRLLITANYAHGGPGECEIVVRDASTGERLREMVLPMTGAGGHQFLASIANLQLSPDETKLAAAYGHSERDTSFIPGLAVLWDIQTGEKLFEFEANALWDITFSPDGTQLALSQTGYTSEDPGPSIPIWDTSTGERVLELFPPLEDEGFSSVSDLEWSPNGTLIAGVVDRQVHLWEAATGEFLRTLEGSVWSVSWSSDGSKLYSYDREWDLVTGEITLKRAPIIQVNDLAWLPDGSGLVITGNSQAQVWNVKNIHTIPAIPESQITLNTYYTHSIAVSPNQTVLATASGIYYGYGSIDLWDAATGTHLLTMDEGDELRYYDVAWSPDGKWLAAGGSGIKVWEAHGAHSEKLHQEFGTNDTAIGVAWSGDSSTLAAVGWGYVAAWDIETGSQVVLFEIPLDQVANVAAWSPDGRYLAVGLGVGVYSEPGQIVLWDTVLQELIQFQGTQPQPVTGLAWSPDGTILAASGGHSPIEVGSHGFSSGSYEGSLILWDVQAREPLRVLYGHTAEVQAVAFSPDGSLLASGSADWTVLIWDVSAIRQAVD